MDRTYNTQTQLLVAGAKAGDRASMEQLFHLYSERILRIVRFRMGNELRSQMQSMDLVQDALMGAFRDLGGFSYRNEGDFLRWVSKIAENRLRDHLERMHMKKRDIRKEVPLSISGDDDSYHPANEPVESVTPSIIMSHREDLNRLELAMDKLKPEYREVIVLSRIEGLTHEQIADRMGKTPGAVRMLLVRALSSIGTFLEDTHD
jgi:RNA polymerase sigma-70 factor (ECF subfamily)